VEVDLPFVCGYCGRSYCVHHRLPEVHSCSNLPLARAPPITLRERAAVPPPRSFAIASLTALRGSELQQLLIAWLVLGFCFSASALFTPAAFPMMFAVSLVTLGFGFVGHELAHRYVARSYGCHAEFRLWPLGLAMAVIFALVSGGRMIFAAPGAVYIVPKSFGFGYGITKRENGLISLSGPLANILVGLGFLLLASFDGFLGLVGSTGFMVNFWLAAFNLLPFGMLDGQKVFSWSPVIWAAVTIPAWLTIFFL
jgi:Zn-dependent protease